MGGEEDISKKMIFDIMKRLMTLDINERRFF